MGQKIMFGFEINHYFYLKTKVYFFLFKKRRYVRFKNFFPSTFNNKMLRNVHFQHPSAGSAPFMTSQRIQMPLQGEKLCKEVLADQYGTTSFL